MKVLCVHQNFPGQYLHLVRHLGADPANQVVFLTQRSDVTIPGVTKLVYKPARGITDGIHHYLQDLEAGVLNGQNVARIALDLRNSGFVPDVMLGHNGWGELWYLKDVFPSAPLIGHFEFFYRSQGADVGFDPQEQPIFDTAPRLRTKNVGNLIGLDAADFGQCATHWQKSLYPEIYHSKLHVIHEGVDTDTVKPDPRARLKVRHLPVELTAADEIVTYVARNLEPYRGFPTFMRSLPRILSERPQAHVVIIGGDETSYGPSLPAGQSFRQQLLDELGDSIDLERVHFLGKVPYSTFIAVLQISSVHVYLTYPFVLSWSMLEAMSVGCVVVGSRTAPVMEVVEDGHNGLLVDFFSPSELADKVIDVLGNRADYEILGVRARKTVIREFDLKRVCLPKQLQLIRRACSSVSP